MLDCVTPKSFCMPKDTIIWAKYQTTEWYNIIFYYMTCREKISKNIMISKDNGSQTKDRQHI